MVRLIQRRLIIPRGDTGSFSIPTLVTPVEDHVAVFSIIDLKTHTNIFQKIVTPSNDVVTISFDHADTVNLPVGKYVWDIKIYKTPVYEIEDENKQILVNGEVIDSYYAAYSLPVCEIRQTGDALLTSDEAPSATLAPTQIDIITAALSEVQDAVEQTQANVSHYPIVQNGNWYVWNVENNEYVDTGYAAAALVDNNIESFNFNKNGSLVMNFANGSSMQSQNNVGSGLKLTRTFYPQFTIGGISTDTGENTSSTSEIGKARLRSQVIPYQYDKLTVVPDSYCSFIIFYYDSQENYVTSTEWLSEQYEISDQYPFFRVLVKIEGVTDFNEYQWDPPYTTLYISNERSLYDWVNQLITDQNIIYEPYEWRYIPND